MTEARRAYDPLTLMENTAMTLVDDAFIAEHITMIYLAGCLATGTGLLLIEAVVSIAKGERMAAPAPVDLVPTTLMAIAWPLTLLLLFFAGLARAMSFVVNRIGERRGSMRTSGGGGSR